MKTIIIHHLDYDCNILMKEIRFMVNDQLDAIFFKHPNGMKKLFRKASKIFESKKDMEKENAEFLHKTRQLIPKPHTTTLLEIIQLVCKTL